MSRRRFWPEDELKRLAELYPVRPTREVAKALDRQVPGVYGMAVKLGLKKSQAFLDSAESGRLRKGQTRPGSEVNQFRKGHVPANKGLRRPGYSVGRGRMQETQFKRGERTGIAAKLWCPVGTIRPDPDGYLRIKVREARRGENTGFGNSKVWPLYSRYLYEQAHGPVPPKHLVVFKDGNRQNCTIDNLEKISMKENARRNHWKNTLPPDLAHAIMLNGALKRKIREAQNGEEQDQRSA